jgi:Zn-finger nucleic acid-binding protein
MICPACKHDMIVIEYHNIELDYCNNCKGVWFDSGELELLLRSQGLKEPEAFCGGILDSKEVSSSEERWNCPICGRKMKKITIGGQPEILIDACRDNHGLWFDGGEVTQLIQRLAGEHPREPDSKGHVVNFLEEVFGPHNQSNNKNQPKIG